jgi:hypothetical protein
MAGGKSRSFTAVGFPAGVNNTLKESELPRDQSGAPVAVREALNLDFSATGKPSLRPGFVLVQGGVNMHSGWSDDYLPFGFEVDGDTLYAVLEDETREALVTGLAMGVPVSYVRINDGVFWSNGVQCGLITTDLQVRDWCAVHPNGQPQLTAQTGGALSAGTYQVAVTFLDETGRETGTTRAAMIEVAEGGAIALGFLPQPPSGYRIRVYCTTGNDGVLRAAATLDGGVTDYLLSQRPTGRKCNTQLLRPMPPGQLVAYGNGRHFVARGREVLFSPSLRYGMFDPKKGRVGFNRRVDFMAFVGDGTDGAGLYVSDGKRTYFLSGANPLEWSPRLAYAWGAMPGRFAWVPGEVWGAQMPKQLLPTWVARNGRLCVGLPGGQIVTPQPREGDPDAVFDTADSAALLFREGQGDRRVIAALQGAKPQAIAIQDQLIVREYRHDQ